MSFFTGWFQRMVCASSDLQSALKQIGSARLDLISAIKRAEMDTGSNFNSKLLKEKFIEIERDVLYVKDQIDDRLDMAFTSHVERNHSKEFNNVRN